MRNGTGLSHAVTLADVAPETVHALARQFFTEWRGAGEERPELRKFEVVDYRVLTQTQHDRRHDVRKAHVIILDRFQERLEIETWHQHDRGAAVQAHVQDD